MSAPQVPPSPDPEPRRRDSEIVAAVFRTAFLLIVLFSQQFLHPRGTQGTLLAAAVIAAAVYNLALFIIHVRGLPFPRPVIVLVDVVLISLWIYLCGAGCTEFFVLYYAVVVVAGLWFGVAGALVTALFACVLYVWAVLATGATGEAEPGTVLLQVTFLIITAGIVGVVARIQERERQALATSRAVLEQYRERIRVAQYVDDLVRPRRLPPSPGLEVAAQYRPAALAFSGDYYDLIPLGGRRWGLCVADVSGKLGEQIGYLNTFKTTLRLTARREQSPARVLAEINREVAAAAADQDELEAFIGMSYVVLDLDTASLTYANAGNEPPVLIRAGPSQPIPLARGGLVLGVVADAAYEEETLLLEARDTLVLFTDGVVEIADRRGRFLGREAFLAEVVRHLDAPSAQEMAVRVFQSVNSYGEGGRRRDDMTLLVARVVTAGLGLGVEWGEE